MSEEFQVRCVRPKDEGDSPASSTLQEAFDLLKEHAFSPSWITQEECRQVEDGNKNCYFVMDPFKGAAFEHLKLVGCRVYGPQCILANLLMKIKIPECQHPIYNLAMKEVVVSCSSLSQPMLDKVHALVMLMGGKVVRAFSKDVTHLIAGKVGSQKYMVAAGWGTPIMTVDWVVHIWEKAQDRYVSALEEQFLKFRCPIFKGLIVTTSGLTPNERMAVKHNIDSEGGRYFGVVKLKECTHLITKEPTGSKYECALIYKVNIVTMLWLFDSLKKNFCQNAKNYPVTHENTRTKTSTPDGSKKSVQIPNITDISTISTSQSLINEAAFQTTCMTMSMNDSKLSQSTTELFFDSCKSEIKGPLLETCNKIINAGDDTSRSILSATSARNTVPSSSAEMGTSDSAANLPLSSASEGERIQQKQTELSNPMAGATAMVATTTLNRSKGLATPVVEELQQQQRHIILSPSVFLTPEFHGNYNLTGVYNFLQSPDLPAENKKRERLMFKEMMTHYLGEAVKKTSVKHDIDPVAGTSQSEDDERGKLFGVVISVSKKLALHQQEYHRIVTELGGGYDWQLSEKCTHFIFEGRASATNKDFRKAKTMGKFIISPHWLYACMEELTRADEAMYPVNYSPDLNLK